jgi:riboflavin biosynthesis pyrimidine reductase
LGIERLALEGGGGVNGSFLAARLVDEFIVIIGPAVHGSTGSRTIVEAGDDGLIGRVRLSLKTCETLANGAVRLTYAVTPDDGA